MRYGVPVQIEVGRPHETVQFIDWGVPGANDFAIAEKVALRGGLPVKNEQWSY